MVVGGGRTLPGHSAVDSIGGRVHGEISWWVPVLGGENGHGLRKAQKRLAVSCAQTVRRAVLTVVGRGEDPLQLDAVVVKNEGRLTRADPFV